MLETSSVSGSLQSCGQEEIQLRAFRAQAELAVELGKARELRTCGNALRCPCEAEAFNSETVVEVPFDKGAGRPCSARDPGE